jgi:hypothetical protein
LSYLLASLPGLRLYLFLIGHSCVKKASYLPFHRGHSPVGLLKNHALSDVEGSSATFLSSQDFSRPFVRLVGGVEVKSVGYEIRIC